ncbi:MAG: HPP family protein [Gammaproteobacteria bacterium]
MRHFLDLAHYVWQPLVAFLFIWAATFALGYTHSLVLSSIGASSLGATALIIFANPGSNPARFTNVLGGYTIGLFCGILCHYASHHFILPKYILNPITFVEIYAAAAVALSILIMAICKMNHPPAAGMALGLVLEAWDYWTLAIILIAACAIALLKIILEPHIKTLV